MTEYLYQVTLSHPSGKPEIERLEVVYKSETHITVKTLDSGQELRISRGWVDNPAQAVWFWTPGGALQDYLDRQNDRIARAKMEIYQAMENKVALSDYYAQHYGGNNDPGS